MGPVELFFGIGIVYASNVCISTSRITSYANTSLILSTNVSTTSRLFITSSACANTSYVYVGGAGHKRGLRGCHSVREREGVGIEGGLEVAEVEGVAELEGTPEEFRSLSLDPYGYETENQARHLTSNTSIPTVETKSSSWWGDHVELERRSLYWGGD